MKLIFYHRIDLQEWSPEPCFSLSSLENGQAKYVSGIEYHIHVRELEKNSEGFLLIIHAKDIREVRTGGAYLRDIERHAAGKFGTIIGTILLTTDEQGYGILEKRIINNVEMPVFYWNSISELIGYIKLGKPLDLDLIFKFLSHELSILVAISVLCTGFLVTHARYTGLDEDWEEDRDIRPALERIGNIEPSLLDGSELGKEKDSVRKPIWWLEPFGLWDEESQGITRDVQRVKAFKNSLESEWSFTFQGEMPVELVNLMEAMIKCEEIRSPKMVADVYCAIAKKKMTYQY